MKKSTKEQIALNTAIVGTIGGAATAVVLLSRNPPPPDPSELTPQVITLTAYDDEGEQYHIPMMPDPATIFEALELPQGDANFDGRVDLDDLNTVLGNFGTGVE